MQPLCWELKAASLVFYPLGLKNKNINIRGVGVQIQQENKDILIILSGLKKIKTTTISYFT